jgi:hypothetical protein
MTQNPPDADRLGLQRGKDRTGNPFQRSFLLWKTRR